jgi:hypothetical protein
LEQLPFIEPYEQLMRTYLPLGHDDALLASDYSYAHVDLVWLRDGKSRTLVLGLVTLLPSEYPLLDHRQESDTKIKSLGRQSDVNFQRFTLPLQDALSWVSATSSGVTCLPGKPEKGMASSQLVLEPDRGGWNVSDGYPFTDSKAYANARVQHWVATSPLDRALEVWTDPEAVSWIQATCGVRCNDFKVWCGSVHVVALNPVYRRLEHTLLTQPDGSDGMYLRFTPRARQSVRGLQLSVVEIRPHGFGTVHNVCIEQSQFVLARTGMMNMVALAVTCPHRGLLEWHGPVGWFRHPHSNRLPALLETESWSNQTKARAQELDQRWFFQNSVEAKAYVRGLFATARNRIIIVDPYFAETELSLLDRAIFQRNISVTVLTSGERLKSEKEDDGYARDFGAQRMLDMLANFRAQFDLKVRVAAGKPIHDRFIVIDEDVRISGNSLQELGERGSLMMRVPEPSAIMATIDGVLGESLELAAWARNYIAARAARANSGQPQAPSDGVAYE